MAEPFVWAFSALNVAWAAWNCYAARANHKTAQEIHRQIGQLGVLKRAHGVKGEQR